MYYRDYVYAISCLHVYAVYYRKASCVVISAHRERGDRDTLYNRCFIVFLRGCHAVSNVPDSVL